MPGSGFPPNVQSSSLLVESHVLLAQPDTALLSLTPIPKIHNSSAPPELAQYMPCCPILPHELSLKPIPSLHDYPSTHGLAQTCLPTTRGLCCLALAPLSSLRAESLELLDSPDISPKSPTPIQSTHTPCDHSGLCVCTRAVPCLLHVPSPTSTQSLPS